MWQYDSLLRMYSGLTAEPAAVEIIESLISRPALGFLFLINKAGSGMLCAPFLFSRNSCTLPCDRYHSARRSKYFLHSGWSICLFALRICLVWRWAGSDVPAAAVVDTSPNIADNSMASIFLTDMTILSVCHSFQYRMEGWNGQIVGSFRLIQPTKLAV